DGKTTIEAAEPLLHHVVKISGEARSLEHTAHEDEHRDRQQHETRGGAERLDAKRVERLRSPQKIGADDGCTAEREHERQTGDHEQQERSEEKDRDQFDAHTWISADLSATSSGKNSVPVRAM